MSRPDVLVLGGGIIGLACARVLVREGLSVEVVERLSAGAEASTAAAGMLAPLSETPVPGPFLDACRASRDLWPSWVAGLQEESGLAIDYDTGGAFHLALGEEEETGLDRLALGAAEIGEPAVEVEPAVLAHRIPGVSPEVRRALHLLGEHRVDNIQACAALAVACRRLGVILSYGVHIEEVRRQGDGVRVMGHGYTRDAGCLVLAAGAWSGGVGGRGGLPPLPVRPVRGQMMLLAGIDWPWKGTVRGTPFYAVRRGATGLLVGATVEEAGFSAHTTPAGIESLLAFVRRYLPGLAGARLETLWAGLRPGTPDGLPILGPLPEWPVVVATGHYRNGILLAPWTAEQVALLISAGAIGSAGASNEDDPFSPSRFLAEATVRR
ncbi:MAG TPA: glycine oxidase ThiO [Thermoanaerobaculia bacterium]|nr:glycine oxidase ThiO [Thermoanaerobaculia bacterium]